jgi:hypothetical protein
MRLFPDADAVKECIINSLGTQIKGGTSQFERKVRVNDHRNVFRCQLLPSQQTRNCGRENILLIWRLLSNLLNGMAWQRTCYWYKRRSASCDFHAFRNQEINWSSLRNVECCAIRRHYRIRFSCSSCRIRKLVLIRCKQNNVSNSWWYACDGCYKETSFQRVRNYAMRSMLKSVINFIWPNSCLHYCQYTVFLEKANAQGDNLLLHNAVRWLGKDGYSYVAKLFMNCYKYWPPIHNLNKRVYNLPSIDETVSVIFKNPVRIAQ